LRIFQKLKGKRKLKSFKGKFRLEWVVEGAGEGLVVLVELFVKKRNDEMTVEYEE
jgi:hypothetical protein